jgi:hypothetical protein
MKNKVLNDNDNGIYAIPKPKYIPDYNMAELYLYCKSKNIQPNELTQEEKQMFIINNAEE